MSDQQPDKIEGGWSTVPISDLLAPLEDGRTLHQGWSPRCEKEPSNSESEWGVLKTTSIQPATFLPEHNKRLPAHLEPRPQIEVKPGDILITCAGPRSRCGIACLVRSTRRRLMMSGKMYRFRPDPLRIDPRYLEAYLQTPEAQAAIDQMKTGGNESGLNLTHDRFRQLLVPVAPLDQQKHIVAEIEKQFSRLDEAVANLKRVKANLKRYKAAVLKAAVEGRLVETEAELARREGRSYETGEQLLQRILETRRSQWKGKGKYKEPASPDTTDLPELPDGWVWASADQVMALITDGEHITPQRSDSGVLLLSARNVLNGRLDLTDVDYIPEEEHQRLCKRLTISEGDVLLSCSGSVGRSCVVPGGVSFSLVRSVAVLRPAIISSDFVCYQLQSPWLQAQIKGKQTQTAQANIFQGKIRQLVFALPPDVEQDRIIAEVDRRLSLLRETENQVDANRVRTERLRQSVLDRAFSGRIGHMGDSAASGVTDQLLVRA